MSFLHAALQLLYMLFAPCAGEEPGGGGGGLRGLLPHHEKLKMPEMHWPYSTLHILKSFLCNLLSDSKLPKSYSQVEKKKHFCAILLCFWARSTEISVNQLFLVHFGQKCNYTLHRSVTNCFHGMCRKVVLNGVIDSSLLLKLSNSWISQNIVSVKRYSIILFLVNTFWI